MHVMVCPICEKGTLHKKIVDVVRHGMFIGHFKADVCSHCQEQIFDSKVAKKIEQKMQTLGIWNAEKATIYRIGGNFALALTAKVVKALGISKTSKPLVIPQTKERRFIVEF